MGRLRTQPTGYQGHTRRGKIGGPSLTPIGVAVRKRSLANETQPLAAAANSWRPGGEEITQVLEKSAASLDLGRARLPVHHSRSALLEASSLLPLRATSPMKAALMIIRHRRMENTMTTGFFIGSGLLPQIAASAKLAGSLDPAVMVRTVFKASADRNTLVGPPSRERDPFGRYSGWLQRLSGHLVSLGVDESLDYFAGLLSLRKGANRSIGIGKNVVVLCSLEISFIVCR